MPASPSVAPKKLATSPRASQRYDVKERIARGGMGAVHRALDRATGEEVALKRVLLDDPKRSAMFVAAFEREYQVLASLDHPRIIRVFDYGVDADSPYYTMELVRGRDLSKAAPLPWREVCLYLRDVASSLALLHARRLLHRDLSPSNVKIGADGHAKLLDFGALTDFGVNEWLAGTPPLVPPEAIRGEPLDQRSDIYALGALAYWALTGRHAFPATKLEQLINYWQEPPIPPTQYTPDVPRALEQLVLGLLSRDPLARPASAALVIGRLNVIAQLEPESESDRRRIAQSFLIVPPFVGRDAELELLTEKLAKAIDDRGSSVRVEAIAGSGRSRLLEEMSVRAQLSGVTALRVDAAMHPNTHGTTRALAMRLLDALPDLAREHVKRHAGMIATMGKDVEYRLALTPSRPPLGVHEEAPTDPGTDLSDWLIDVSRHKPLLVAVDNVESCDKASLGVLASLASRIRNESILLLVSERLRREPDPRRGLVMLREHAQTLPLSNLTPAGTAMLARSLFGEVPNVERFADWLHGHSAGSPLHCVEISRQLIAQDVIRHEGGLWLLPGGRPQIEIPEALEDALSVRIAKLSTRALSLAQLLALQHGEPTLESCVQLSRRPEQEVIALLDELARFDVLYSEPTGYRFVSAALRDALLATMSERDLKRAHARLGEVYESRARGDAEALMEAGWHYMRGGMEMHGADLVARVLRNPWSTRGFANRAYQVSPMADAALKIYKRHRRSVYLRLPLVAALAQASYFEDYTLTDRYADEALDLVDDIGGLRVARQLRRWFGAWVGLALALFVAWCRFIAAPRADRPYSFLDLIRLSMNTVSPLVAAKSTALDADRAQLIAQVIEPFSKLPERTTLRAVYDICQGMQQIGREHQAQVFSIFDTITKRLADPKRYPLLPAEARPLFQAGAHFGRGAFAMFRADAELTLESADFLDASGNKLYQMMAAQLRYFYHAQRGELPAASKHRAQMEVLSAQVGSAWNVELWAPAALIPLAMSSGDPVALAQILRRLEELARIDPALELYRQLAELALTLVRHEGVEERIEKYVEQARALLDERVPRSFIGWSTLVAGIGGAYNRLGRFREAREICERALVLTSDEDRQYVALFLEADLQAAIADAGLGRIELALARVDALLERFVSSGHPLALGRLHETRAIISHGAGKLREYKHHLQQMDRWLRPTGTPALIAKCERVADLEPLPDTARRRVPEPLAGGQVDTAQTEVGKRP